METAHKNILTDLKREFEPLANDWGFTIDEDRLSIAFTAPELVFNTNSAEIRQGLQRVLREFFPRYLAFTSRHKDILEEIRIEGHADATGGYFHNMLLSGSRAHAVFEFCYNLSDAADRRRMEEYFTTSGMSYARAAGDVERSRRAEFTIRLDAARIIGGKDDRI